MFTTQVDENIMLISFAWISCIFIFLLVSPVYLIVCSPNDTLRPLYCTTLYQKCMGLTHVAASHHSVPSGADHGPANGHAPPVALGTRIVVHHGHQGLLEGVGGGASGWNTHSRGIMSMIVMKENRHTVCRLGLTYRQLHTGRDTEACTDTHTHTHTPLITHWWVFPSRWCSRGNYWTGWFRGRGHKPAGPGHSESHALPAWSWRCHCWSLGKLEYESWGR